MIQTVQLAINNPVYRTALEHALFETGSWRVVPVAAPDPERGGVIVLDAQALDKLKALQRPERVVLITHKDPQHLARAWDAGIISVVFEDDPVSTAMLAIMSAGLRVPHAEAGVEPVTGCRPPSPGLVPETKLTGPVVRPGEFPCQCLSRKTKSPGRER